MMVTICKQRIYTSPITGARVLEKYFPSENGEPEYVITQILGVGRRERKMRIRRNWARVCRYTDLERWRSSTGRAADL